jgi:uncharacterized membrane protein
MGATDVTNCNQAESCDCRSTFGLEVARNFKWRAAPQLGCGGATDVNAAQREPRTDATLGAKSALPGHADSSVAAIEAIHAQHDQRASPWQRRLEALTRAAATPAFCAATALSLGTWIGWHVAWGAGAAVPDPRPFEWFEGIGTWAALFMTALILATQRRADEFAEARERLMLELALLGEKKSAKLIEMVEQLRRDLPQIENLHDSEARDMSRPIDPQALFEAVDPGARPPDGHA